MRATQEAFANARRLSKEPPTCPDPTKPTSAPKGSVTESALKKFRQAADAAKKELAATGRDPSEYVPNANLENIGRGYGQAAEAPFAGPTSVSPLQGYYGPFWRSEPAAAVDAIQASRTILGNPPTNFFQSDIPAVKAYQGPIPPGASGVQFYTPVPPTTVFPGSGNQVWWTGKPGTVHEIPVIITGRSH
jgi:hypothetical protein